MLPVVYKYWVGVQQGIGMCRGQVELFSRLTIFLKIMSRLKYRCLWHFIITTLKMSEISSDIIRHNEVNGAWTLREVPDRCPVGSQRRRSRHQKTARTEWFKEMNVAVMECYFLSRPFDEEGKPIRGYRKRMHNLWKERQGLKVTEQSNSSLTKLGWSGWMDG